MREKIRILTLKGDYISLDEWQKKYGLVVGSTQIGKYFTLTESRFFRDLQEFGSLTIAEPHMIVADKARELWGHPLTFSSYNRTQEKQDELRAEPGTAGLRAEVSPHVVKLAGDIDLKTRLEVIAFVPVLMAAAVAVHVKIRVGFRQYLDKGAEVEKATGQKDTWTFVHFDVCPEYYAPGKPWHNKPHPKVWEIETSW